MRKFMFIVVATFAAAPAIAEGCRDHGQQSSQCGLGQTYDGALGKCVPLVSS
ncbi:hypothetical protein GCM10008927_16840 [Amylibacter ulvae]|uniref:Adenylosuccinate lyase n=1 Tax=Paramylibacter ulvae TaxID=1651968 RepID=A0ABQ3D223_9RHOB|nr:hypothetical protein [Amylibacter ulvae]GHA51949.1 hypothetical protein GCM10008927_16840 [Amylibacter ulvae]